ncbi:MAG: LLM class flavin-dependent oxidoreductase [Candidatus Limnocylindrales bacterium]
MSVASPGAVRFGAQLWSQATSWDDFLAAARRAEACGWDAIWTWDHLMAIQGPWQQPIFEGWLALGAVAASTQRVQVGLMVGANTFRTPGLTAKLATTLDHISHGRAVLGLGAGWFEREHEGFGLPFGATPGWRLDRLDEAVGLLRRLLDGELVTHAGPAYPMRDALVAPRPVRLRLPILIGGSGPRKTLRIVARHADAWNTAGTREAVGERLRLLADHCAAVGRDPATVELTASFPIVLRDRVAAADARWHQLLAHNGVAGMEGAPVLVGPPALVADRLRPYVELGFRTFIVRLPAPYDGPTLERIGEVRDLLAA